MDTIAIMKSMKPVLEENGLNVTRKFYEILFSANPTALRFFTLEFGLDKENAYEDAAAADDTDHLKSSTCPHLEGKLVQGSQVCSVFQPKLEGTAKFGYGFQAKRLADTLLAYCTHIDELDKLSPAIDRIARAHVMRGVSEEHYALVGDALIKAIKEVLKDAASPAVIEAFKENFGSLSSLFIQKEADLVAELESASGGWKGYRDFHVDEQVGTGTDLRYLVSPADGKDLLALDSPRRVVVRWKDPCHGILCKTVTVKPSSSSQWEIAIPTSSTLEPDTRSSSFLLGSCIHAGSVIELSPPTTF